MPRPGSACSSYLVQTENAAVLLDLGSGALGKLQLAIDYARLDAIVISHMHADHFLDLVPLRYGLKYGEPPRAERIPLWLPPGGVTGCKRCGKSSGATTTATSSRGLSGCASTTQPKRSKSAICV